MSNVIPITTESKLARKQEMLRIANAITEGNFDGIQVQTPNDIALVFNIPVDQAVALLNDDEFMNIVTMYTQAKLNTSYHGLAVNKLLSIIQNAEDDKVALQAINTLAKLNGKIQSGFNVHLGLEGLLTELDSKKNAPRVTLGETEREDDILELFSNDGGSHYE